MRHKKVLSAITVFSLFTILTAVGAYADQTQTWVLTTANPGGPACSSTSPCAQITLDVNGAGTAATFTVTSLDNGYIFDTFGFNAETGGNGNQGSGTAISLSLGSTSGEVSGPSLGGSGKEDGWGTFDYNFNTGENGGSNGGDCSVSGGVASAGCTFTFTVNGTGLTLADFEYISTGGNGSGIFAGHSANLIGPTGYIGNPQTPAPVPEPSSLAMLGSGLFGLATIARRKLRG